MKSKKILSYVLGGAVLILVLVFIFLYARFTNDDYTVKTVEPTCTKKGYTIYTYSNGTTKFKDITNETGHSFKEWEKSSTAANEEQRICERCGFIETKKTGIEQNIPTVSFYGSLGGIGKKTEVKLSFSYREADDFFDGFATLKHQGHSSLKYEKKNYTVKLYDDSELENKKHIVFKNWNKEYKYILKANYVDASNIRNLVCADIWSEMVASRREVNKRLLKTSHNGAVDGFPVAVYINDEFHGLYDLMLHKDDGLFLMSEGKKDGIVISNEGNFDEALFKKQVDWDAEETWEIEYCGTENKKWIQNKFNSFSEFVLKSDDKKFKKDLKKYADVPSVIDYIIAVYTLGLNDKDSKDILFATYDNSPWIASLFDTETAFGLSEDGTEIYGFENKLPVRNNGTWEYNSENILFIKMLDCFYDEICERYLELRKTVLSEEKLINIIEHREKQIPAEIMKNDFELYPNRHGKDIADSKQIKEYITQRIKLTDEIFVK